jgi:hypothetical protein
MTEDDTGGPAPLVIKTPEQDADGAIIPFRLDDDEKVLTAVRPKMAILVRVLAALGDDSNPMKQAIELERLLDKVVDEDSAAHLRERFYDTDDDLDLLVLGPVIETLVGKWYGGPTGKRPASPGSRSRSGPSSTGRRRSRG